MSDRRDVRAELTVFLLCAGEETVEACREALTAQTCAFRFEEIEGVFPMSRAFQTMPERCRTPYFVQVDADMVLVPDAIERLYDGLRGARPWTVMVWGQLEEEGFGPGGAVKCWRRRLFRFAQFRDVRAVDRDLFGRIRWLGLRPQPLPGRFGLHRPRHSAFAAYVKAKGDVEKWRYLRRPASQQALPLVDALLAGYPQTRDRLLGALMGALTIGRRLSRSKDLRFEQALFTKMISRLAWSDAAAAAAMSEADRTMLRRLFAASYEGPRRRREGARRQLAQALWAILRAAPGPFASFEAVLAQALE